MDFLLKHRAFVLEVMDSTLKMLDSVDWDRRSGNQTADRDRRSSFDDRESPGTKNDEFDTKNTGSSTKSDGFDTENDGSST